MEADGEEEQRSRDLLRRFAGAGSSANEQGEVAGGESEEIELSLGLSMNGSFGLVPDRAKIARSSSIASLTVLLREEEFPAAAEVTLARTHSLPLEMAEEQRKRKELQSLKRLEAKRKRVEKRNSRPAGRPDEYTGEAAAGRTGKLETQLGKRVTGAPLGLPAGPVRTASQVVDVAAGCFAQPASQGSIGSQCSSSSGVSDFESRQVQGFEVTVRTDALAHSLPEHATTPRVTAPSSTTVAGRSGGCEDHPLRRNTTGEMEKNMMEQMPCVSTKGEGPNGRRIEGFLYKYRTGEEVRIVCICHGSFLTPAEFVKHAGGGEVAHPLKHIVINPSPSALLR